MRKRLDTLAVEVWALHGWFTLRYTRTPWSDRWMWTVKDFDGNEIVNHRRLRKALEVATLVPSRLEAARQQVKGERE